MQIEHQQALFRGPVSQVDRAERAARLMKKLTPRQMDVLNGMANGLLNKQIASFLMIDEKTVKMHRALVLRRLNVSHSAQAIRIAVEASFAASGAGGLDSSRF
jgi:DNA-binding NarL/FixJ family response regulator